jgi:monoamine oxidase
MYYDIVIVGAGIAGLRMGIELRRLYPHLSCCILERYNYTGGRIFTFRTSLPRIGKVQWESGAGRISTSHHKVLSLLKRYHLTVFPMSSQLIYQDLSTIAEDPFSALHDVFLSPLRQLSKKILQTHTVGELLNQILGPTDAKSYYQQFPYWSEIHSLRADRALLAFDSEMSSMSGFVGCIEGLSSLTDHMKEEFLTHGGQIQYNMEVSAVSPLTNGGIVFTCKTCPIQSNIGILAIHRNAAAHIQGVHQLPVLSKLRMEPLLRMYAIFPIKKGKCWFSDLSKTVTNGPLRFIIPINSRKGIIMISYTDGDDARYWMKKSHSIIQQHVMKLIRQLYSDRVIPDPILFKLNSWENGCTYWQPGLYDVEEESKKSLHPLPEKLPHLFLCGESFSAHPCWMESALDQADQLLTLPAFQKAIR